MSFQSGYLMQNIYFELKDYFLKLLCICIDIRRFNGEFNQYRRELNIHKILLKQKK